MGLQTIVSRNVNITEAPAIVTVGRFTGENRSNIVPDTVELEGTVRFADESALPVGVRVMTNLAPDYLFGGK